MRNLKRIEYKFFGDDHKYIITPFNYFFKKRKVFNSDKKNNYSVRDKVSFINFNNWITAYSCIDVSNHDTNVIISGELDSNSIIYINNSKKTTFDLKKKDDSQIFKVDIQDSPISYLHIFKGKVSCLKVNNAKKVSLQGNKGFLKVLIVRAREMEIAGSHFNINDLQFYGDNLSILESRCNIANCLLSSLSNLTLVNTNIMSENGSFEIKKKPLINNSMWLFQNQVQYNNGSIGSKDKGIVLDSDTFNDDKSIDMMRARLSYIIKKIKEKSENINGENMKPLLDKIEEREIGLIQYYDERKRKLERDKENISKEFAKKKVKTLF